MKLTDFCLAFYLAFGEPLIHRHAPNGGCGGRERAEPLLWGQGPGSSAMGKGQSPGRWGCSCLHGDRPAILPEFCQEGGKILLRQKVQASSTRVKIQGSWLPEWPEESMFPELQLPQFVNEVADGRPSWPVLGTPVISRRDDFQQYRSNV